ncbi:MAG TPA: patatin-like phospholipase family protein [Gemmataceae bacterium]|jgi:hypothetical protein|nr:patatin-like phospholipase family protein [Gemmataceae bacterium]
MPTNDGTKDYRNNPEPVFHTELNAVAARRRRFRIERILGRLPEAPEPFPKPERLPSVEPLAQAVPVSPNATAPIPPVDSLKSLGEATRAARKTLADKRNALAEPVNAHDPASVEFKEAPSAKPEAEAYYDQAKIWYEAAKAHRDAILAQAGNNTASVAVKASLDEAEAILRVAVRNLAEAANEVRRERESSRSALPPEVGEREIVLKDACAHVLAWKEDKLRNPYGQVLAWELEVLKLLETPTPPCPTKLADARHQLALAEYKLFEVAHDSESDRPEIKADCRLARDAAQEEVQRWQREKNLSGPASCSAVPPCHDLEGIKGGSPIPEIRVREHALDMDMVGLCLSGGGIRSATFGLGMLQGLAQLRLLGAVDMLSTVSGGGYIGSWLTAWIQREKSLTNVEKQLSPNRVSQAEAERFQVLRETLKDVALDDVPRDAEPEPVHHLRAYSRYLSPRFGAFAPDTWTLFAIYFRNLFVNSLFFVPLAVVVVFAWILLLNGFIPPPAFTGATIWEGLLTTRFALSAVFLLAFGAAVVNWVREQENLFEADLNAPELQPTKGNPWSQHWGILFPLFLVGLVGPWIFDLDRGGNVGKSYDQASKLRYFGQTTVEQMLPGLGALLQFAICFGALCLGLVLFVQFVRWWRRCHLLKKRAPFNVHGACASCTFAVFFGLFFYLAMDLVVWRLSYAAMEGELVAGKPIQLANYCLLHSIGVPLVFVALILAGYVEMALVGLWLSEFEREWRSRIAAYLSMGATAWLLFAMAIFLIPWLIDILPGMIVKNWPHQARAAVKSVFTALWAAISGGGAWAAWNSGKQPGRQPGWISWALMNVAPSVFLLGLLACVSLFGQNLLGFVGHNRLVGDLITAQTPVLADQWQFLNHTVTETANYGIAMLCAAALTLIFGFFVSVNPFSLHMLYANRLTRCYLGASRRKEPAGGLGTPTGVREPSPVRFADLFTGFDPSDDLPISDLRTVDESVHYAGPLPLINCTLNRVAGGELAVQDRQADAFLITPQWCGGALTGYVHTPGISSKEKNGNLSLGRSLTISGAAVDPNMNGLSPPLTALMTLLNTRLGWWLEHPNPKKRATFSQVPTLSRGT